MAMNILMVPLPINEYQNILLILTFETFLYMFHIYVSYHILLECIYRLIKMLN